MSAVISRVLLAAVVAVGILLPQGVDAQEPCDGFSAVSRFQVDDPPIKLVYLLAHQAAMSDSHARAHAAGAAIVFEQPFDGIYRWPQLFGGMVYNPDPDRSADGSSEVWRYHGHVDVVGVGVTSPGVVVLTACFPTIDGHIHGPHVVAHFGRLSRPMLLPPTGPAVDVGLVVASALILMISGAALLRMSKRTR